MSQHLPRMPHTGKVLHLAYGVSNEVCSVSTETHWGAAASCHPCPRLGWGRLSSTWWPELLGRTPQSSWAGHSHPASWQHQKVQTQNEETWKVWFENLINKRTEGKWIRAFWEISMWISSTFPCKIYFSKKSLFLSLHIGKFKIINTVWNKRIIILMWAPINEATGPENITNKIIIHNLWIKYDYIHHYLKIYTDKMSIFLIKTDTFKSHQSVVWQLRFVRLA